MGRWPLRRTCRGCRSNRVARARRPPSSRTPLVADTRAPAARFGFAALLLARPARLQRTRWIAPAQMPLARQGWCCIPLEPEAGGPLNGRSLPTHTAWAARGRCALLLAGLARGRVRSGKEVGAGENGRRRSPVEGLAKGPSCVLVDKIQLVQDCMSTTQPFRRGLHRHEEGCSCACRVPAAVCRIGFGAGAPAQVRACGASPQAPERHSRSRLHQPWPARVER
mmetsp:Transcript_8534/g.27200  ORF Transcript_8534/g.27200 Transcript_8534/m.27200 type:complete len:224 (-) Transcript_8534:167-838(-)